ncbi:extensin [archaeon SCG-AAA382B04]|nr:extensin [archaeon SCG-AAA382B04]
MRLEPKNIENPKMEIKNLTKHGLPSKALRLIEQKGIEELYPPQQKAIEKGVLKDENLVLSIPTASGKTLVAEMAMLKQLHQGGTTLYIVPLRALASEKYQEFKEYEKHGFRVGISTGDYDRSAEYLTDYDIVVTTSEKADSMLRTDTSWLNNIDVIVSDEIHLVNSSDRGPTLEVTLAKLREMNPNAQILALSATISNADEIADWLDANLVKSDWRPVELRQGVLYSQKIEFPYHDSKKLKSKAKDKASALVKDTIKEDGQALVFANSRRNSKAAARKAGKAIKNQISKELKQELKEVSEEILDAGETTEEIEALASFVKNGTAHHHAGLLNNHREIIEQNFKEGKIKAIAATPTLAWGVNLPARRVVIRSYKRYDPNYGMKPVPVLDIKQMLGRAGRPGLDPYGESILIAKNRRERQAIVDRYIIGETEPIQSKLSQEPALRTHILSTVATNFASSESDIIDFLEKTFYSEQNVLSEIKRKTNNVLDFLESEGFIVRENSSDLKSTKLGNKVSELYIDPKSASKILKRISRGDIKEEIDLLHMICETPDMDLLYMKKSDYELVQSYLENHSWLKEGKELEDWFLSEIKTSMLLKDWISEKTNKQITQKFGVNQGDIRRHASTAEWLLHASAELSKATTNLYHQKLRELQNRMKYGVKKQLLPLTKIKGIGRIRARKLYKKDYKSLSDLKTASKKELSKVESIGPKTAQKIKQELKR